jgi:hypothetical protein
VAAENFHPWCGHRVHLLFSFCIFNSIKILNLDNFELFFNSTLVVEISNFSDNSSNNKVSAAAAATGTEETALLSRISENHADFNLNSGCSFSMTPFISNVNHLTLDLTPVCLANSTTVKATHVGRFLIPLGEETSIKTLVVSKLHKPLLSIAGFCDQGLTVIFGKSSCQIFTTSNLLILGHQSVLVVYIGTLNPLRIYKVKKKYDDSCLLFFEFVSNLNRYEKIKCCSSDLFEIQINVVQEIKFVFLLLQLHNPYHCVELRNFWDLEREKRKGAARFQGSLERLGVRKRKEEPMSFYSF